MVSKKTEDDHKEQYLELTYKVKVRTFGKRSKMVGDLGQSLADMLGLKFTDVEVSRGKDVYARRVNTPWSEDESGFVDNCTYADVVSKA